MALNPVQEQRHLVSEAVGKVLVQTKLARREGESDENLRTAKDALKSVAPTMKGIKGLSQEDQVARFDQVLEALGNTKDALGAVEPSVAEDGEDLRAPLVQVAVALLSRAVAPANKGKQIAAERDFAAYLEEKNRASHSYAGSSADDSDDDSDDGDSPETW